MGYDASVGQAIRLAHMTQSVGSSAVAGQPRSSPLPIVRWSAPLFRHLVIAADAILLLLAGWAAAPLPSGSSLIPASLHALVFAGLLAGSTMYLVDKCGAYHLARFRQVARPVVEVAIAVLLSAAAAAAVAILLANPTRADFIWLGRWTGFSLLLLGISRQVVRIVAARGVRSGALLRKVAIVGANDMAEQLIEQLSDPRLPQPCRIIGVFDDRAVGRRPPTVGNFQVGGNVDALCAYAATEHVDLIVIALPWSRAMQIWTMMQRLQWISADVMIPLERDGFNPRVANVASIAGEPALQVMRQPLQGARALLKIGEDYLVASIALVVTAPVMLIAAIAIRLDSPGPILFRQPRNGFNKGVFSCFKFRTMYVDPNDTGVVGVTRDNPRITRVGGILRRLSIDELPQLLNVLRGEMSVVGPRPHVPGMKVGEQDYTEAVREYASRYRIKPGITGWAQINGMRGGIHTVEKARRGVDLDMHYIENWSIWLDIRIMARTLLIGMAGRNVF